MQLRSFRPWHVWLPPPFCCADCPVAAVGRSVHPGNSVHRLGASELGHLAQGRIFHVAGASAGRWTVMVVHESKESREHSRDSILMPRMKQGICAAPALSRVRSTVAPVGGTPAVLSLQVVEHGFAVDRCQFPPDSASDQERPAVAAPGMRKLLPSFGGDELLPRLASASPHGARPGEWGSIRSISAFLEPTETELLAFLEPSLFL